MKYELTDTKKQVNGVTLFQIKALKSFGDIKEGDLGGWIEKEDNLSQDGIAHELAPHWIKWFHNAT